MSLAYNLKLIGLNKILRTIASVARYGYTLLALLDSATNSGNNAAIEDEHEKVSYHDLHKQALQLAYFLNNKYQIKSGCKIAIVGNNSVALVRALFAVSGLGADVYLLNPNQRKNYFDSAVSQNKISHIISDPALCAELSFYNIPVYSLAETIITTPALSLPNVVQRKRGSVIILSSGSTGEPKPEKRNVSATSFLDPLVDIIDKLHLKENSSVLISVPLFHGYGLAALLLSVFLQQKIYLTDKFNTEKTLKILADNTDCWIAVPLMIRKVQESKGFQLLKVKNIISGGDTLPPDLVKLIHDTTSARLYNMYGTSETGVCTIATHNDLLRYPDTIGRLIKGSEARLSYREKISFDSIGEISIRCGWSADKRRNEFVSTGDLVSQNEEGYYFFKGRRDDLIIIGGENVYPIELETVLYRHPNVKWVKVKAVMDEHQSMQIHLEIVLKTDLVLNELQKWIDENVPKYMVPRHITVLDQEPNSKLM